VGDRRTIKPGLREKKQFARPVNHFRDLKKGDDLFSGRWRERSPKKTARKGKAAPGERGRGGSTRKNGLDEREGGHLRESAGLQKGEREKSERRCF